MANTVLDDFTQDFKRLQDQKTRDSGNPEARILMNLAFLMGEQWVRYENQTILNPELDANKLYLVFNLVGARFRKLLGRLTSTAPVFRATPNKREATAFSDAEVVDKLHAICVLCGMPASRNQRLIDGKPARYDSPQIMVGGTESYEARCRACHTVLKGDQPSLL